PVCRRPLGRAGSRNAGRTVAPGRLPLLRHNQSTTFCTGRRDPSMATDIRLKEGLPEITEALVSTYTECSHINHLGHKPLPSRESVVEILAALTEILYPGYGRR